MRSLILTGYNDTFAPIGDLTAPLMHEYADRHGLAFRCVRSYKPGTHPSWQKMGVIRRSLLAGYDRVIWIDADTVITNMDAKPWELMTDGLTVSRDWGTDAGPSDFSMGNFVACEETIPLWQAAEKFAEEWANQPLWEQSAIRAMYAKNHWVREMVHIAPRRVLNAVPASIAPGDFTPSVVDPWQPGDWLCHLTMVAIAERVRLFYEVMDTPKTTPVPKLWGFPVVVGPCVDSFSPTAKQITDSISKVPY